MRRLPLNGRRVVILLAGAGALSGAAAVAVAQEDVPVELTVDATVPATHLERVWSFHGYDEINYTVDPEGTALLGALVAAHSAPVRVRSHFLFNSGDGVPAMKWGSTNVYREDSAGKPVYDWAITDGIFDALTGAGAFPLVELGFMPEALSTHPTPYRNSGVTTLDGGCFYPPKDHARWAELVRTWARHADARYPQVASTWLWELWNEPDIGYWQGTATDYAKLYDFTEAALHQAIPGAPLGGPAVADSAGPFMTSFLQHCASGRNAVTGATGTRLDFISFHAKGGVVYTGSHPLMDLGSQLRQHESGFRAVAAVAPFRRTPIYISEADPDGCAACPASRIPGNAYRLSPAYGAYVLAMMKRSLELEARVGIRLGGVLTWAFTFPGTPYFAGYRVLASNGIGLPVMGAFELLGRLEGSRLPLASTGARPLDDLLAAGVRGEPDIDGIATVAGDVIRVLAWNYHDLVTEAPDRPVRLRVQVPPAFGARATVSHLRVDGTHGNAYAAWVAMGKPAAPDADQQASLREAMHPADLAPESTVDVEVEVDGSVEVDFSLPRFAMSLVTIRPAAGGEGWRGDAGELPPPAGEQGPGGAGGGGVPGAACGCATAPLGEAGLVTLALALIIVQRTRRTGRLCRPATPFANSTDNFAPLSTNTKGGTSTPHRQTPTHDSQRPARPGRGEPE